MTEIIQAATLSKRKGTRHGYKCYVISTHYSGTSYTIPSGTRWQAAIKFPANIEMGLLSIDIYDVIGSSSDRLWNLTLFPTSEWDTVMALDGSGDYIPGTIWEEMGNEGAIEDCSILTMFNITQSKATQIDLSAYREFAIKDLSMLVACSATSDGAGAEYAEFVLNAVALRKTSVAEDPIVY